MINVIYDISLLGISHRNQHVSGLMRTAEHLLYVLSDIPNLLLTVGNDLSFDVWLQCHYYLEQNDPYGQLPRLPDVRASMIRKKLYELSDELIGRVRRSRIITREETLRRWVLKLLNFQFNGISYDHLQDVDLYYSPYHHIPSVVRENKQIKQVLTVHDIIPILYPDFFELNIDSIKQKFHPEFDLLKSLDSINPDVWITCPSQATKQDLFHYLGDKIDREKVSVIPWAASDLFYVCQNSQKNDLVRQKYGLPEGPYILSLSTLEPRKNLEHLVRCFTHLVTQEKISDLSLVLAGCLGWQYKTILQEISDNSSIAERVILTGYVADDDLAALYSNALVFVYPSFYEGFGLPPLEAMQCGTPVITSNTSSLPEVIGEAGIMVDPRDQIGLCQHLLKIYQCSALQADLSKKSLAQAQQFSWQTCAQQMMTVYRQALA